MNVTTTPPWPHDEALTVALIAQLGPPCLDCDPDIELTHVDYDADRLPNVIVTVSHDDTCPFAARGVVRDTRGHSRE